MRYSYKTNGTCSRLINFDLIDGKMYNVEFIGGCNGNLKGIASLVEGMSADEIIDKLGGIRCGFKRTSCPNELASALSEKLRKVGD